MKALIIIFSIIILTVLFFRIPVYADLVLGEENSVIIGYMFFKKKIFPSEKKEKAEKSTKKTVNKKQKKEEKKPKQPKKETDGEGFKEILEIIKAELPNVSAYIKGILGAVKIRRLNILWRIGGEDACETAVKYGKCSGLFYTVYGMVSGLIDIKTENVDISPDFLSEEGKFNLKTRIYVIPSKIISSTVVFAFKFIIDYIKLNNKNEKVECKNESTGTSGK